jgi:hypothetical protein
MEADAVVTGVVTGVLGSGLGWTARAGYERMLQKRPVAVRVDEDIKVVFPNTPAWISFPYFIPQLPADIPPPPARVFDWWAWAKDNGGSPAIWAESVMTISVRSKASVLVDVFDVEIVEAVDAPAGSTVFQGTGGADITTRQISVKLNEFVSSVKYLDQGGADHQGGFEFALMPGEFGRLHIAVEAQDRSRLYRWRGKLGLVVNGKRRTMKIQDENGKPFVLHGGGEESWFTWNTENGWTR